MIQDKNMKILKFSQNVSVLNFLFAHDSYTGCLPSIFANYFKLSK